MRTASFRYSKAGSLSEAVAQMESGATALAGGQSLVQVMKLRQAAPDHLVDIGGIPGIAEIQSLDNGSIRIGALVRHREVASSTLLRESFPWVAEAASKIGDTQVRNRGTIAGNLCFADPRANMPPVLISLGAQLTVAGPGGERWMPVEELFGGFRQNTLAPGELVVAVELPGWPGTVRGQYLEIARQPNGVAMVNVAVTVADPGGGPVGVAAGGLAPTPLRLSRVEAKLSGRPITEAVIAEAVAELTAEPLQPLDDLHAPASYRVDVAKVLLKRALLATVR